ncbi:hypothetical protein NU219Hw_g4117t1 [Hortaea werneckii]
MEDQSNATFAEEVPNWVWLSVLQGMNLGFGIYCSLNFSRILWKAGCYLGRPVGAALVKLSVDALNKDYGVGYFVEKAKNDGKGTGPASAEEHEVIRKRREEAERQVAGAVSLVLCWPCMLYYVFSIPLEIWKLPEISGILVMRWIIVCLCMIKGALIGIVALLTLSGFARLHGLS